MTRPQTNVTQLVASLQQFGYVDCTIFILMLAVCSAIGLYFGVKDKRKHKKNSRRRRSIELDYLVGGRKMKVFPVAMSCIASWVSGISLLGMPSDVYVYGTDFVFSLFALGMAGVITRYIFLPIYMELQLTSANEYLEARFDKRIRILCAFIFTVTVITWLPITIYAPAIAFNQVTGINIHVITPITCLVCIFYTSLGGMKAVIWTDVIQIVIMYGTMLLILVKGTIDVGGFGVIWERNYNSGRIVLPEMTVDPTVRHSILSVLIGGTIYYTQTLAVNQSYIQRFLSLPDMKSASRAFWIFMIGLIALLAIFFYNGLVIYATYHDCDPLTTKMVKVKDQLLPALVMNLFRDYPGLIGLFASGIFSAALSTISTLLNAVSAVVLEDFVKQLYPNQLSQLVTNIIMRGVVVVIGVACVALVFVVEQLGSILQLSMSLGSLSFGIIFSIYIIGILMPWINGKSVLTGGIVASIIMTWVIVKAQTAQLAGKMIFAQMPVATNGCTYDFIVNTNSTRRITWMDMSDEIFPIYFVSYLYYGSLALIITVVASNLATCIFGREEIEQLDSTLVAVFLRKYFKLARPKDVEFKGYITVNFVNAKCGNNLDKM